MEQQDHANSETEQSGLSFQTYAIGAVLSFVAIYVVIFLIGFIAALAFDGTAAFFAYFRNLLLIAMTLTTMVIFVGIGILIIQIARFVNLLRSELQPITSDTRKAISEVRSTFGFVQKHAVEPIIRTQSFLAGLVAFLREIIRISRILQQKDPVQPDHQE